MVEEKLRVEALEKRMAALERGDTGGETYGFEEMIANVCFARLLDRSNDVQCRKRRVA